MLADAISKAVPSANVNEDTLSEPSSVLPVGDALFGKEFLTNIFGINNLWKAQFDFGTGLGVDKAL